MIKSILVCTDGSPHSEVACEYAIHLTQRIQGHLTALHVLDSRMLEGPLMSDISGWVGAQPFGAQLQQFRDLLQQKGEAVVEAVADKCEKAGVKAETRLEMGHPVSVILEQERKAELVVLGQNGEHVEFADEMLGSTVERVLRHSVKPCLVVPSAFKAITKILAAYDGSDHSSRALHEAIELAQELKVPLSILTVTEEKDFEKANAITREGLEMAKAHNCEANHLVAKGPADVGILNTAEKFGYDLLVMGAYGHSRIREMILGSVTTQVVARTDLPVMLVR